MGRTIISGLQPLLDMASCRTDTTLDLILADTSELHFATDTFTANGNDYVGDLRAGGEIKQTISSSPDRLQVAIQNIDKSIGGIVAAEDLVNAEAIVGRYYRDPAGVLTAKWIELFRGRAIPLTIDEIGVALEIINDLAAAGYCVGDWTLAENCVFVFKHAGTCGYAGSETLCNKRRRSPDGCFGRDNEHRFGGMEFPEIQAAEVGSGGSGGSGGGWGGGYCFIGSTMVDIDARLRMPFEKLYRLRKTMIGGRIASFDENGDLRPDVILDVFRSWVYSYLEVKFASADEPTGVIWSHPFWNERREFQQIGSFLPGDKVWENIGGNWLLDTIESIREVSVPDGVWVYNLTTRDFHHYFANRKAVHNRKDVDDT